MERLKLTKIQNLLSDEVIKFILKKERIILTEKITYKNKNIYFDRMDKFNKENKKINLISYYLIRNLAFNPTIEFTSIICQYILFSNKNWKIEIKTQNILFY